jgi:hypothetical protein
VLESPSAKRLQWPTPQDYNEAIQSLAVSTRDETLRSGVLATDVLGLPRPVTGAFASVYRIKCGNIDYAFRCFLRNIEDQEHRYRSISEFISSDDLPYTVTFDFMAEGIAVNERWFPALKMEWVEGSTLEHFLSRHFRDRGRILALAGKFKQMCHDLIDAGIAHGDLQHGNIIVTESLELRLVDYDGMFVPSMVGLNSNELGHRNYQHPARDVHHFGAYLDNFSSWLIYVSLRAIAADPSLFELLGGGDDCLLFRRDDLVQPLYSKAFWLLERHSDRNIRLLARYLRSVLRIDPKDVEPLCDAVPKVENVEPLAGPIARASAMASIAQGMALPRWMLEEKPSQQTTAKQISTVNTKPAVASPTPAALPIRGLEPEFALYPFVPRRVCWKGGMHPLIVQALQIFNPALWVVGYLLTGLAQSDMLIEHFYGIAIGLLVLIIIEKAIWAKPLQFRRLARYGLPAIAEITFAGKTSIVDYSIEYEFKTSAGQVVQVQRTMSQASFSIVSKGDRVTVLYDPENAAERNVLYMFSPYKISSRPPLAVTLTLALQQFLQRPAALFQRGLVKTFRVIRGFDPHNVPNPVPVTEQELNETAPRKTKFDERSEGVSSLVWNILMLFNPLVWVMFIQWFFYLFYNVQSILVPAVVLTGINLLLELLIFWKARKDLRLVKYGTAVQGQVTRKTCTADERFARMDIEYGFRTADGRVLKRFMKVNKKQFESVKEHELLTVLYYDGPFGTESVIYKFATYNAISNPAHLIPRHRI